MGASRKAAKVSKSLKKFREGAIPSGRKGAKMIVAGRRKKEDA